MTIGSRDTDDALRRIIRTHGRAMTNLARRYERDPLTVEEIVADAIELAHRHIDTLDAAPDAQARGWLLRTVRYLCNNQIRRGIARRRAFDRLAQSPLPLVAPSAEDEFGERRQRADDAAVGERIRAVLDRLPDGHREVLVMDALGASGSEIGDALGITAPAARKRIERARLAFRIAWTDRSCDINPSIGGDPDA